MPYPKRGPAPKENQEDVDVEATAPLDESDGALPSELLDVGATGTMRVGAIDPDLLEDGTVIESGEEIEVEYVDEHGVHVPEMAEEVVMEGDYVEEYIDEPMHEDDMAESLVALSRSGEYSEKAEGVEYVVDTIETKRKQPRILRRFAHQQQQQFADQPQSYVDSRQILVDDYQPVASAGRDTRFTPKFPVAVARRGLTQSIRSSSKSDWREDQCKKLLVCDVLESLPDHKQNAFKRLMDLMGVNVPGHQPSSKRKYAETSPGYYPDVEGGETVAARQSQKGARYEGRYTEQPRYVVTSNSSRNTRVVAMIPFEEKPGSENADRNDGADMPELIQNDVREGERPADNDADEGEIDIETYEEDNSTDGHKPGTIWIETKDVDLKVAPYRGGSLQYSDLRDDVYGSPELRTLNVSHHKDDERFCPSCRMTMKRSIYYHHGRLIRKYGRCDIFTPKRFPCGSAGCHERLGTLERLCEHMFQVHRAPTEIKRKVFDTEAQFEEFLRELESRGGNFRMSRGNKTIKEGIVQYFRCNRIFSIAKDKALRIVDDITAGTYEAVKDITQPMDPFGKETSTKPYLRTEEACTAFFRKTYLNDGTIEVRYCDHHLHGDERLRLPTAIRNRIHEMMKKRLPLPVIVMVLQRECHRFCMPGTALERRIMAVTPREVQLVAQSVQRRIDAASKRKRAVESQSGISQNSYETGEDVNEGRREDDEAAENIIERADDQDSHVANEHLMDVAEEDTTTSGSIEDNMSLANEGRGEGGELTEVELAMLEEYEQNRGVILTDFQSLKREENRKRLCRERVRAKIYTLGRAMRNIQFSDFECDLLIRSEEMLESVVELWNARMDAANKQNKELDKSAGQRQMVVGAADSKHDLHPGSECTSDPTSPTHTTGSANTTTDAGAEEEPDAQRDAERDTSMVEHSDLSQAVASAAEPPQDVVASASTKPKARARPRRGARTEKPEKTVKEEFPPKPSTPTVSPPVLPAISRLGRVIKKKKILDV